MIDFSLLRQVIGARKKENHAKFILKMGFCFALLFEVSAEAMQDPCKSILNEQKKFTLTDSEWLEFYKSGMNEFAQSAGKNITLLGYVRLPGNFFLAVLLGTLKQKNDLCIFSRKIPYASGVAGIQSLLFVHSKMVCSHTINRIITIECSTDPACLCFNLEVENGDQQYNDQLFFEDYSNMDSMRLIKLG
jgi:hypothetical protein